MQDPQLDFQLEHYSATQTKSHRSKAAQMFAYGAAAAGGLLSCSQAGADIVYSGPLNQLVPDGNNFLVDIDIDGDFEFSINNVGSTGQTARGFAIQQQSAGFGFISAGNTQVVRGYASSGDASSGQNFVGGTGWMGLASGGGVYSDPWGAFANPSASQTGIFGFQFNGVSSGGGSATLYGWAQLKLHYSDTNNDNLPGPGDNLTMTLLDYAYQDTAGATIHYGDTTTIPEPATGLGAMALLAMGAVGLRRRRKEQKA